MILEKIETKNGSVVECKCDNCNKLYYCGYGEASVYKNHFCSRSCFTKFKKIYVCGVNNPFYGKHHTEENILKNRNTHLDIKKPMGELSTNWKGGRIKTTRGYTQIYKPEHPNCNYSGYVMEHRLVMESFLGRYLTPQEVIHHINEKLDDNQIENLMLFNTNIKHKQYHTQLKSA